MIPYFKELRGVMYMHDVTQKDIAKELKCSTGAISQRFRGQYSFSLEEAYAIMQILNLPLEQLPKYFPPLPKKQKGVIHAEKLIKTKYAFNQ